MLRMRSLVGFRRGFVLLLVGMTLCVTGCGSGKKRIIFLTNGNSPFFDTARAGLQKANEELKLSDSGLVAVLEPNDGTAEGQLTKLRQYATQNDIAGVAVSVVDSKVVAIAEELRNLANCE